MLANQQRPIDWFHMQQVRSTISNIQKSNYRRNPVTEPFSEYISLSEHLYHSSLSFDDRSMFKGTPFVTYRVVHIVLGRSIRVRKVL